jgi:hypothetical protein
VAVTSAVKFLCFETIATAPPQKRKLTELCGRSPESPKQSGNLAAADERSRESGSLGQESNPSA